MREAILRKVRESTELSRAFFATEAGALEEASRALAARLQQGGRLLAMGNGGSAADATHAAVEFQHPIIEKRRPLPAMQLGAEPALVTAIGNDTDFSRIFLEQLEVIARPEDALLGISTSGASANVNRALRRGRELGLLTIGFSGRDGGPMRTVCDHSFVVPSWSVHRVQEAHTMLLHLLWDLVHVAMGEPDVL